MDCAASVTASRIVWLDHSPVMIAQASAAIRRVHARDRIEMFEAGVDRRADWPATFDRILSVDVIQFVEDPVSFFRRARAALSSDGACFTTYQPRLAMDARTEADRMADMVGNEMAAAGFRDITPAEFVSGGTPAARVSGRRAAA